MKLNNLVKSTGFAVTLLISGTTLNAPVMAGGGKFVTVPTEQDAYAYVCPQFNNLNKQMQFIVEEGINESNIEQKLCEKPDVLPSALMKSLNTKVEAVKPVQQDTKGPGCFYHPIYGWLCR